MKKTYFTPQADIVSFSEKDIIVTSDCYYDDTCEGCDVECTGKCTREGTY